jgi:MFS family permease
VLLFTLGLGRSPSFVSGVVFPLVAVGMAASAPISGKLADRWGPVQLLKVAVPVYGAGLLLPGFSQAAWVLACVPVVAAAAATVMVVPFAALMRVMPDDDHGAVAGVFTLSRGAGTMLGPLLAGGAISLLRGPLSATRGFAAMWFVIGAATLATWPLLQRLRLDRGTG